MPHRFEAPQTMTRLHLVMGDHLSQTVSSLSDIDPETSVVLFVELREEITVVKHHKQKVALILSAMRHFANELKQQGLRVDYVQLDDPDNTQNFKGEVIRAVDRHAASAVVVTEPSEYRVMELVKKLQSELPCAVEIRTDDRFFATPQRFRTWAGDKKQLRMEFFYRELRVETGILMEGRDPAGGQWNFDKENRKALPKSHKAPPRNRFEPDAITQDVIKVVENEFPGHFGETLTFGWAVTRKDALEALDHFVSSCLPQFGDYQDAMKQGNPWLYHSIISPYLNIGLLTAREVCERAENAWKSGRAPLNATEGFIRQILGWREYVRGLYWFKMPGYADTNALDAKRPLPDFYWTAQTQMNCISQAVSETKQNAYAHHIQRLMVTGNFALLAGLNPKAVEEWYLLVYADAFEWVELPNTHGMALYADGGIMASKPYAASGAYINRMSDYCSSCPFDPKKRTGQGACPFNFLYWDFLARNQQKLGRNPRMAMPYKNLTRFKPEERKAIETDALNFLDSIA
jgi:deoxyribodipyrimidine photolyase-related protein